MDDNYYTENQNKNVKLLLATYKNPDLKDRYFRVYLQKALLMDGYSRKQVRNMFKNPDFIRGMLLNINNEYANRYKNEYNKDYSSNLSSLIEPTSKSLEVQELPERIVELPEYLKRDNLDFHPSYNFNPIGRYNNMTDGIINTFTTVHRVDPDWIRLSDGLDLNRSINDLGTIPYRFRNGNLSSEIIIDNQGNVISVTNKKLPYTEQIQAPDDGYIRPSEGYIIPKEWQSSPYNNRLTNRLNVRPNDRYNKGRNNPLDIVVNNSKDVSITGRPWQIISRQEQPNVFTLNLKNLWDLKKRLDSRGITIPVEKWSSYPYKKINNILNTSKLYNFYKDHYYNTKGSIFLPAAYNKDIKGKDAIVHQYGPHKLYLYASDNNDDIVNYSLFYNGRNIKNGTSSYVESESLVNEIFNAISNSTPRLKNNYDGKTVNNTDPNRYNYNYMSDINIGANYNLPGIKINDTSAKRYVYKDAKGNKKTGVYYGVSKNGNLLVTPSEYNTITHAYQYSPRELYSLSNLLNQLIEQHKTNKFDEGSKAVYDNNSNTVLIYNPDKYVTHAFDSFGNIIHLKDPRYSPINLRNPLLKQDRDTRYEYIPNSNTILYQGDSNYTVVKPPQAKTHQQRIKEEADLYEYYKAHPTWRQKELKRQLDKEKDDYLATYKDINPNIPRNSLDDYTEAELKFLYEHNRLGKKQRAKYEEMIRNKK